MNKKITYTVLPPVGAGRMRLRGTLVDLVCSVPNLIYLNVIPPHNILNEVLLSGSKDAGMGGGYEWKPFRISETEYDSLMSELVSNQSWT
jgi:hypothetical protein